MQADLRLPSPPMRGGGVEVVTVPASPEARVLTLDLARREKNLSGPPEPGEDNHLVIAHDGQLAATDLRTVGLETDTPQKVDVLADDIHHEWSMARDNVYLRDDGTEHPVRGGLILVFCDESTPSNSWNFYHELRAQLIARGMAEDTIRFIHEASSPQRRADLLAACREGAVAVLVGSTAKMGAGLNVQDRALGGYEITPPWRPDLSVQAIGRAGRQGNQNPEFFWKRLVLAPSMDAKKWEIASQKHTMFEPLYSSAEPARSRELATDDELGLADAMTAATGDPRYREKAELDRELKTLKRQHSTYLRRQQALKLTISRAGERIPELEEKADRQDVVAQRRVDTRGEQFRMRVRATTYTKRAEAAEALSSLLETAMRAVDRWSYEPEEVTIGEIGGFTLAARLRALPQPQILLHFADAPDSSTGVFLDPDELSTGRGLITRIENQLDALATEGDRTREQIEDERHTIAASRQALEQPFPHAARMEEVTRRRAELISQLSVGEDEAVDPNEDPDSPEARARAERREARAREWLELYDNARDHAQQQRGLSDRAAQRFASWYQTIVSPVVADQRPALHTALSVWTEIGFPDSGGRSTLRALGAAEVGPVGDDITDRTSQHSTAADAVRSEPPVGRATVDTAPQQEATPSAGEPAATTDAAESPIAAILAAAGDRIQLHHIGPTPSRHDATSPQVVASTTPQPADNASDRDAAIKEAGQAAQTAAAPAARTEPDGAVAASAALAEAGLTAEQTRWLHRQTVALAHTVDIRIAERAVPEAAPGFIRDQLDFVLAHHRKGSGPVDSVGREVATRYDNDRAFADRVRGWAIPAVRTLTARNLAAAPAQLVRDLLNDLDLPHTDTDVDWLTAWITGLVRHPQLRQAARVNAEDQFAEVVPNHVFEAFADAMEGPHPPPDSVTAVLMGKDTFVAHRWSDLVRSVVFDAVHDRSASTPSVDEDSPSARTPAEPTREAEVADLPAESPDQVPQEETTALPPDPVTVLRRFRALADEHALQTSVVRVAEAVFITVHEAPTPHQPMLCWRAGDVKAADGVGQPMPLEVVEDYLRRYRPTVDSAWFTLDTSVRHWARRVAQLVPHIVPGARDDQEKLAELVRQAVQHATSDGRHAEDVLRRAENAITPLRLALSREAQVVRAIHDLARGYAWAGDVGRYLTDPAHLDGTRQEWDWINRYAREHPEVLSGAPDLGGIRERDAEETAERDKAATALVKQASAAFREGDFERALELIDLAELLYPEGLSRWDHARNRVMAKAERAEDSLSEAPSAATPPSDEQAPAAALVSVASATEATEAAAAPAVSAADPEAADESMLSVLPADVQVALYARINDEAARWFEDQLDASAEAQRYLQRRLGGQDKVDRVRRAVSSTGGLCIGFAPDSWTGLVEHLRQRGYKDQDLVDAGVATVSSRGTLIDRFRGRIMFGIRNDQGLLAGFTGRALSASVSAKYLNSPASVLFDKSRVLFGLHEQGDLARFAQAVVVVEGPFDVAANIANTPQHRPIVVFATCGTALTSSHLDAIDALVPRDRRRVLAFDSDAGGRRAMVDRATEALGRYDDLGITTLPDGLDPAEYALGVSPEDNAAAYLTPPYTRPALEVLVEARLERWGDRLQWVDGQVSAARDVATLLAAASPDRVSDMAASLADRLQVDVTYLAEFIAEARHVQNLPPDRPLPRLDHGDTMAAPAASTAIAEVPAAEATPGDVRVDQSSSEEAGQANVTREPLDGNDQSAEVSPVTTSGEHAKVEAALTVLSDLHTELASVWWRKPTLPEQLPPVFSDAPITAAQELADLAAHVKQLDDGPQRSQARAALVSALRWHRTSLAFDLNPHGSTARWGRGSDMRDHPAEELMAQAARSARDHQVSDVRWRGLEVSFRFETRPRRLTAWLWPQGAPYKPVGEAVLIKAPDDCLAVPIQPAWLTESPHEIFAAITAAAATLGERAQVARAKVTAILNREHGEVDSREPAPQQETGLVIEHGRPGTVVRGTDESDLELRKMLHDCDFTWSKRQEFWYLPRNWKFDTRNWKVARLRRLLDEAGRTYATQEAENQVEVGPVPAPPADVQPFASLPDLKVAQRGVNIAFGQASDTPAGRDLIASHSASRPEGRALREAMTEVWRYTGDEPAGVLERYQRVYEAAYILHATLTAERKRAPKLMQWLDELVRRSQLFVARLAATDRQHSTTDAAPTVAAAHDESPPHEPASGQEMVETTDHDRASSEDVAVAAVETGLDHGGAAATPGPVPSTAETPTSTSHDENEQAPPTTPQPELSAATPADVSASVEERLAEVTDRKRLLAYVLGDQEQDAVLREMASLALSRRFRNGVHPLEALRRLQETNSEVARRVWAARIGLPAQRGASFDFARARQALSRLAAGDSTFPLNMMGRYVELVVDEPQPAEAGGWIPVSRPESVRGVVVEINPAPGSTRSVEVVIDRDVPAVNGTPRAVDTVEIDAKMLVLDPASRPSAEDRAAAAAAREPQIRAYEDALGVPSPGSATREAEEEDPSHDSDTAAMSAEVAGEQGQLLDTAESARPARRRRSRHNWQPAVLGTAGIEAWQALRHALPAGGEPPPAGLILPRPIDTEFKVARRYRRLYDGAGWPPPGHSTEPPGPLTHADIALALLRATSTWAPGFLGLVQQGLDKPISDSPFRHSIIVRSHNEPDSGETERVIAWKTFGGREQLGRKNGHLEVEVGHLRAGAVEFEELGRWLRPALTPQHEQFFSSIDPHWRRFAEHDGAYLSSEEKVARRELQEVIETVVAETLTNALNKHVRTVHDDQPAFLTAALDRAIRIMETGDPAGTTHLLETIAVKPEPEHPLSDPVEDSTAAAVTERQAELAESSPHADDDSASEDRAPQATPAQPAAEDPTTDRADDTTSAEPTTGAQPGSWVQRISIEVTGSTALVTGTDREDPAALREALKKNGFWWTPQEGKVWKYRPEIARVSRDTAVQAIRNALAELDAHEKPEKSTASPGPNYPPTPQQQAIIDACLQGKDVAVRALAGTGKTSTMRMVADRMPHKKITYIAFNRSIADEAQEAFGRNVRADTMHAFARQALRGVPEYRRKLGSVARRDGFPEQVARALGLDPEEPVRYGPKTAPQEVDTPRLVQLAQGAVKRFRESADRELGQRHLGKPGEDRALNALVLDYAKRIWEDKADPQGVLPFTHDDYLKLWALTSPTIPGDVVIFDEAQDVNELQATLVQAQDAQVIVVGDSYQSIYGFRGARDYLRNWPAEVVLPLTKSWRFGPAVADTGNLFLRLLKSPLQLEGNAALDTRLAPVPEPDAVLCRTNTGAVAAVFTGLEEGKRVALVGGGDEITKLAKAAKNLQRGWSTRHEDLRMFESWRQVQDYVNDNDDAQSLRTVVRLIDKHTPDGLIDMADQLVDETITDPELAAELVVSTAHKA